MRDWSALPSTRNLPEPASMRTERAPAPSMVASRSAWWGQSAAADVAPRAASRVKAMAAGFIMEISLPFAEGTAGGLESSPKSGNQHPGRLRVRAHLLQPEAIERVQQLLAVGVRPGLIAAGRDPLLREIRKRPVLAIGDVPELDGAAGVEAGIGDGVGMEMPFADDVGA